MNMHIMA